jgi:putative transposase
MPWDEVKPMDQKILFVADSLRHKANHSELCRLYGISRKTGYKWLARFQSRGPEGLCDQSRRPREHPLRTPYAVRQAIIELRTGRRDPPGPKKIQALLELAHPNWQIPSRTTIYTILVQEGLIHSRRSRHRVAAGQRPFSAAYQPNDLWSADFKGQFKTRDGTWCYPLTVMDHQSRYLLACQNQPGTRFEQTKAVFEALFREYGLPGRIRTDNGVPFASLSPAGLSRLSIWWIRLGIAPERIDPGKPQQNGRHERMHRTLKRAATIPPAATPEHQQRAFDAFCTEYNQQRPHEALGQDFPANVYQPSPRPMPERVPELAYPGHVQVKLVNHNGIINHQGHRVYIAGLLRGEHVGVEEIADGTWDVYFGPIRLGSFDMRTIKKVRNDYLKMNV